MNLKLLSVVVALVFCFTSTTFAFAQNDDKIVVFDTEFGHLAIELFFDDAPNTAESFLKLAETGYYDGTIFHRIIKDFMIQGGDPNTKEYSITSEYVDGEKQVTRPDQNTWGQGGEKYGGGNLDAEFNTIKHDRGIISMARSQHPDSAGSQFFIVHKNSPHLDEQYTVFGRIITQESYDTLDMIANLEVTPKGTPIEISKTEIKKTEIITRSDLENQTLALAAPERLEMSQIKEPQRYSNAEYGFSFMPQPGWLLREGGIQGSDTIVVWAEGLSKDGVTPSIIFEAVETNGGTLDEFIEPYMEKYHNVSNEISLQIVSEEYRQVGGKTKYNGFEIVVLQPLSSSEIISPSDLVKFKQVFLEGTKFHYVMSYSNKANNFDEGLVAFNNIIESFMITTYIGSGTTSAGSGANTEDVIVLNDKSFNETEQGGCLIATATFGTEMAPQVQFLREIRDNIVLQTESGTSFMTTFNQFYYSFSPTIADYERENPIFKESVKLAITPLLTSLTLLQFADIDSESEMLGYGIGVILLNIGMYFAIPAAFIIKIRKLQ